ncbi:MAG: OadG family protein [Deltaproteobacteria bacterium]|nr:OadG family protein [Deltaproteobacteria bacterium]
MAMIDWNLALKIFTFGLGAVFASLAILIAAIYAFGKILKNIEKKNNN